MAFIVSMNWIIIGLGEAIVWTIDNLLLIETQKQIHDNIKHYGIGSTFAQVTWLIAW